MKPGRELDALVAEKVLGNIVSQNEVFADVYISPDGLVETIKDKRLRRLLPKYSTDISAAFEVVDKLKKYACDLTWYAGEGQCWSCSFWSTSETSHEVRKPTAPHAICLAALSLIEMRKEVV